MRNNKTQYITTVGMLCAVAYIFTLIGHFIPLYFNGFLKYDPKDAIIVIAGFALGPMASLIISVIVAFLELVTISTTGFIGFGMNILASVSFACIAALVYRYKRSVPWAVAGLILSSAVTVGAMVLWNYLVTPWYMGVPREVVADMLLPVFLPFNAIKCGLNTALALLIYKPCVQAMRRVGLLNVRSGGGKGMRKSTSLLITVFALALMGGMIALFIILK